MLYTISTAGHIDHGKSTLVRALTGIDPDRLPEEKAREMTIELGFAWFNLEDGSEVAIVDVPGHERFVDAMITGVGSIDLVMFIVAADDGWMPQSQEHLEILEYLGANNGFVVLTKIDLVDADWIELIKEDLKTKVAGTFLEGAPICEFSGSDNTGLDAIQAELNSRLSRTEERSHPDLPRLYADRVFSMTGHGMVATGTMRDGVFQVGEDIKVLPNNLNGRIKSIQPHKRAREMTQAGSRVALNISGVSHNEVSRGCAIVRSKAFEGTNSIAAKVRISPHSRLPLDHNRAVKILIGTSKARAQAFVFKDDKLTPGVDRVCEFWFEEKTLIRIGDRFVIRLPTPDILIGGGMVIDTDLNRHPRSSKNEKKRLDQRNMDDLASLVEQEIRSKSLVEKDELLVSLNRSRVDVKNTADGLVSDGRILEFPAGLAHADVVDKLSAKLVGEIEKYHKKHPARRGYPKAEISTKLNVDDDLVEALLSHLKSSGKIGTEGAFVTQAGFRSQLKPEQSRFREDILAAFKADRQNPPSRQQIEKKAFGVAEVVKFMLDSGELTDIPGGLLLLTEDFDKIRESVIQHLKTSGQLAVSDIRKMFGYSRKYAVPILEKLDGMKVTKRVGDHRVLFE